VENRTVQDAHKRLGEVIRIGPSEISVNCVDDGIKIIYGRGFEKIPIYSFFENYGFVFLMAFVIPPKSLLTYQFRFSNLFSTLDSKQHAVKRKRISNIYSKSHLQSSEDIRVITKTVLYDRFLPFILERTCNEESVNVCELFQASAMDLATAYSFGLKSSTNFVQQNNKRSEWLDLYLRSRPRDYVFFLQEFPTLTFCLSKIGIHLVPKNRLAINDEVDAWCLAMCDGAEESISALNCGAERMPGQFPVVYEQIKRVITAKEEISAEANIVLNSAASRHEGTKVGKILSIPRSKQQLEIASELLDQLIATHETFGITLLYIYWELSQNLKMQNQLREELLHLSWPPITNLMSEDIPSAKDVDELPLLHAIVMETLRLHPAVPGGQPRITPPRSKSKLGKYIDIPEHIRVSAYAWNLHRNPDAFPDPEGWHPKRWLENSSNSKQWKGIDNKERWFWAFGSGGRMCIGSNFAMQCKYASLLVSNLER